MNVATKTINLFIYLILHLSLSVKIHLILFRRIQLILKNYNLLLFLKFEKFNF